MSTSKGPSTILEVPQTVSKWPSLRSIKDDWQGLQKPLAVHHSEEFDWTVNHLKGNRCFNRLLNSSRKEYRSIKLLPIVLCGIFGGLVTMFLLHFSYAFHLDVTAIIGLVVAIVISVLLMFCYSSRCVLSLVLPSLGTRQGKAILMSILAAQLLSGPAGNLTYNMKQTTNSLVCFSNMTVNQTQQISKGIRDSINNFTQKLRMNELGQVVETVQGFKNIFDVVPSIFSFGIQEKIEESIGIDKLRNQIKNTTKSIKDAKGILNSAKGNVSEEVNVYIRQFLSVTNFFRLATLLTLIFLLFSCWLYYFRFQHSLAFDNIYVTHLLKRFDQHCSQRGGIKLFPLRPRERKKIIDSVSLKMSPFELKALLISLAIYTAHCVVTIVLCVADWTLNTFMKIIERNVNGSVAWNETAVFTINKIDFKMEIRMDFDAQRCVATPRDLKTESLVVIAIIYIVLGLAVASQAYCLRFRHAIVAYYYPERNAERIQYLYNRLIKKREKTKLSLKFRMFFHQAENAAVSGLAQNSDGVVKKRLLSVVRKFGLFRRKCLACGFPENSEFKKCPNTLITCSSIFCPTCFEDMNNTCYVCQG